MIESLVRDGNKIIFATSFGFQNCMLSEAKKHPDVYFEQATGTLQAKNMAEYFGAGEDSIYLAGMAAGAATKKNLIGQVVAFPIPEVLRHASAFALGAQAANPKAKLKLVFTNSWIDQAKDKKGAEALHAAGADVLSQNVDSTAIGQYAQSVGVPWVGYNADARKFAPTSWLTAADLQLGRLLRAARQGGDQRHVEDGLLLREHQGRLHRSRSRSGRRSARRRRRRSRPSGSS